MILVRNFNLAPEGSAKTSLLDASTLSNTPYPCPPRLFASQWNRLLGSLVEMDIPMQFHVSSSSLFLSRIECVFLCFLKPSINMLFIKSGVVNDPVWYKISGLSNHSPVSLCSGININRSPSQFRIKPEWCRQPAYHARLGALCKLLRWSRLTSDRQSTMMKELQRDAAFYAQNANFAVDPEGNPARMTRFC